MANPASRPQARCRRSRANRSSTPLDIEVREPVAKHAITLKQVERWLDGVTSSPNDMVKKSKLKMLMMGR